MSYWIVWPVGIVVWLALGWAAFAYFEAKALSHGARKDQITLSMFCYTIGSKFPLSILMAGLLIGIFVGGLGVHFLWHWCPPGSVSTGMLMENCQITFDHGQTSVFGCLLGDGGVHLTLND